MLTSLAFILLSGLLLGTLARRLGLPPLIGMLLAGIVLGPNALNLLSDTMLSLSADLRQLALIIILLRAGLALNLDELKRAGRPALLLCFVPACFEIGGMLLLAPRLLGVSLLDAAILGAVIAAVSPAVIVPRMLTLMQQGYGTSKSIPQMILAGASVDDVFVIVLFTAFTGLAQGHTLTAMSFAQIPLAVVLGLALGALVGAAFAALFARVHIRDSVKALLLLSVCFLFVALEAIAKGRIPLSGLLAVMAMGATLLHRRGVVARRLSEKFSKLWIAAEIVLFVLVGAAVDVRYAVAAGGAALIALLGALLLRMAGVFVCLLRTPLSRRERLFCMIAYCPKATVQAAIGAIPLAMGLPCGKLVLTVAVLSIVLTAPLGALAIDRSYRHLLTHDA